MKSFQKSIGAFLLTLFSLFILAPDAHAQSALDDIKARLESEGISVIDYSTPEGKWGSLPADWVNYLNDKGYSSLKDVIDKNDLEGYFIGEESLTDLRRQLDRATAEKSRLTDDDEIKQKELDIALIKEGIDFQEKKIKDILAKVVSSASSASKKTEGKNLLFEEIDFYYNYSKWGRLPNRIISILEEQPEEYKSLQDIVDLHGIENVEEAMTEIPELSADDASIIADSVQILYAPGEGQLNLIAREIANTIKNLLLGIAIVWITYAGARMVFAQGDESVITEQKRSLIYAGVGLMAVLLVDRGIDFLYGPAGAPRTELLQDEGFTNEIYGIVNFVKALIGTIAILFIVISGVRILFATGEEDVITKQKKSLLWVGVGLILIAIDRIIIEQIFIQPSRDQSNQIQTGNVQSVINTFGNVLQFILGFAGLVAFGLLIYGAATMVLNYGNDEMVSKSKKIIQNAIIGIIVILSSYVIVSTLIVFQ